MIAQIISNYISQNSRLTIPALGTILRAGRGSKLLFAEFINGDDDLLRALLIEQGAVEIEAAAKVEEFATAALAVLDRGESFEIEGVGVLTRGEDGVISFSAVTIVVKPLPKPEPQPEPEVVVAEPEVDVVEVVSPLDFAEPTPAPRKGVDIVMIVSFSAIAFAIAIICYSIFVKWQVGEISLPAPVDNLLLKIFGDGLSGVEIVK